MDRDRRAFTAFLSHYKVEAATEARWLQGELERKLGGRAFLDRCARTRARLPSPALLRRLRCVRVPVTTSKT